ncbi:MAG: DUF1801 domain-containing protein [Patescibacteria group bacterium]
MLDDIKKYNAAQLAGYKKICNALMKVIGQELKKAERKMWHGSPVWFLDGNPIVGYSVRKHGVQLLFWSGQSFKNSGLDPEGSFKAAEMYYADIDEVKITVLRGWLKQAKRIQWDYGNIVKRKGKLVKIGNW